MKSIKKINSIASTLLLVVMCFMFAACPEPDPDVEGDSLVNILKRYKWEHTDVSDFTDTDYGGYWGTSTYRLYFMDDNIGYHYAVEKDHDTSFGNSQDTYFDKFTYSVSGNTVKLKFKTGQDIYTYKDGLLVLGADSYYEPSTMTQSDRDFVNRKAQEILEEEENEEISSNIYSYVDVTGDFDEEDLVVEFTINTELGREYPGKTFKYGIEYGYGNYSYTAYCEMSGKSYKTFTVSVLFGASALYMESYNSLRKKIAEGVKLTQSEKELLKSVVYYIEKDVKNFQGRVFVEFDSERYYVYDRFSAKIDLDDSYNSSNSGGSDDSGGNDDSDDGNSGYTGTIRGHKYVDLGLSVKWATCNIGADSPEDYGDYFAWGETSTKSEYTSDNSVTYKKNFSDIAGNSNYDAARANWGGSWRLPTKAEWEELIEKCTWKWTTQGGHNGYKVVGPNGNSIFLPAAGYRYGTSLYNAGEYGLYWSSTPNESNTQYACCLGFRSGGHSVSWDYRCYGHSVRPVSE